MTTPVRHIGISGGGGIIRVTKSAVITKASSSSTEALRDLNITGKNWERAYYKFDSPIPSFRWIESSDPGGRLAQGQFTQIAPGGGSLTPPIQSWNANLLSKDFDIDTISWDTKDDSFPFVEGLQTICSFDFGIGAPVPSNKTALLTLPKPARLNAGFATGAPKKPDLTGAGDAWFGLVIQFPFDNLDSPGNPDFVNGDFLSFPTGSELKIIV